MALNLSASVKEGLQMSVLKVLDQVDDSLIDDDLFEVEAEVLNIALKWEAFGRALRLPQSKLALIKAEQGITQQQCLHETLNEFLKMNYDSKKYGEPSWRLIVIALAHKAGGDNTELALKVAKNHLIARVDKTKAMKRKDFTALMTASRAGNVELAQILLDKGADANSKNSEGWTALMAAASNGRCGTVDILLRYGAEPDLQDETGWSALMAAVFKRHDDVALRLIEGGAKPHIQDKDQTNALLLAIGRNEQEAVVDALLNHVSGPELDIQDSCGETALIFACKNRNLKLVKRLLSMGANPDIENICGETATMVATTLNEKEILNALLENNANPNKGLLHLAAVSDTPSGNIVELLVSHGADPAQQNKHGVTAYEVAEAKNLTELAQTLKPKQLPSQTSAIGDALRLTITSLASLHSHLSRGPLFLNPDTDNTGGFSWLHF